MHLGVRLLLQHRVIQLEPSFARAALKAPAGKVC